MDFNLSHSRGRIVLLVGRNRLFGIDVEETGRVRKSIDIADRFFSRKEAQALSALPDDAKPLRFIEYWTLKEAYIKARGMGLRLPLDQFSFELESSDGEISISFGPRITDRPSRWWFALDPPAPQPRSKAQKMPRHQLAWAIERDENGGVPRIVQHDASQLFLPSKDKEHSE